MAVKITLMSPADASKLWCPHVRNLYLAGHQGNKVAASYNADRTHNKCISTNCMMWFQNEDGLGGCGLNQAAVADSRIVE
jgi:hypothetical protein